MQTDQLHGSCLPQRHPSSTSKPMLWSPRQTEASRKLSVCLTHAPGLPTCWMVTCSQKLPGSSWPKSWKRRQLEASRKLAESSAAAERALRA